MPSSVVALRGLPASGKSTFAEQVVAAEPEKWTRINWDSIRYGIIDPNYRFNKRNEERVRQISFQQANEALSAGKSLIIDNTNLTDKSVAPWADLARQHGATFEIQRFDTPLRECIRRDGLRTGRARVGRAVIEGMALRNGMIAWGQHDYVIVDLDGTIANLDHRLHHIKCERKNWAAFHAEVLHDSVIEPIAQLVRDLHLRYRPIIVTGRPMDHPCGINTEDWLYENQIPFYHLFMRNQPSNVLDSEVKQGILDLLPKQQIKLVLEDRTRVVEMWRRNGLTCLQVAAGDF